MHADKITCDRNVSSISGGWKWTNDGGMGKPASPSLDSYHCLMFLPLVHSLSIAQPNYKNASSISVS